VKLLEGIEDAVIPAIFATVAGILAAILVFMAVAVLSALLLSLSATNGMPTMIGPPVALIAGVFMFVKVFEKLR
jgi:hypothetical protein